MPRKQVPQQKSFVKSNKETVFLGELNRSLQSRLGFHPGILAATYKPLLFAKVNLSLSLDIVLFQALHKEPV